MYNYTTASFSSIWIRSFTWIEFFFGFLGGDNYSDISKDFHGGRITGSEISACQDIPVPKKKRKLSLEKLFCFQEIQKHRDMSNRVNKNFLQLFCCHQTWYSFLQLTNKFTILFLFLYNLNDTPISALINAKSNLCKLIWGNPDMCIRMKVVVRFT